MFTIAIQGETAPAPDTPPTPVDVVSPGYFRTMGIKLDAGRDFDNRDTKTSPAVASVNNTFARLHFDETHSIGRRLSLGGSPADANIAVIGIVDDIRDGNPRDAAQPTVYRPLAQAAPQIGWHTAAIVVRTSSDPLKLSEPVRRAILAIAPATAVYDIATMQHRLAESAAPERQRALLFGLFAATAVILTAVGLYGFLAYAVTQDMYEFGVRLALGASPAQLLGLVMLRGVSPAFAGIVLGIGGALVLTRVLGGFLYGVTPTDLSTFIVAALTMVMLAVAASVVPARRAMDADPIIVLRAE